MGAWAWDGCRSCHVSPGCRQQMGMAPMHAVSVECSSCDKFKSRMESREDVPAPFPSCPCPSHASHSPHRTSVLCSSSTSVSPSPRLPSSPISPFIVRFASHPYSTCPLSAKPSAISQLGRSGCADPDRSAAACPLHEACTYFFPPLSFSPSSYFFSFLFLSCSFLFLFLYMLEMR